MFCLFMSSKSLVFCGCDISWAAHVVINLFCVVFNCLLFCICFFLFFTLRFVLAPCFARLSVEN